MMTDDLFAKLRDPFPAQDIEWRIGESGKGPKGIWAKVLAYIDGRAVMDRLDNVVGPANWRDSYHAGPGGGVLCRLEIRAGDEWIAKEDAAENTNIEAVKGGISDSFKRAAVKWGIGRYLYDLPEGWANVHDKGKHYARLSEKNGRDPFRWDPPLLPEWALPSGQAPPPKPRTSEQNAARKAAADEVPPEVDESTKRWDDFRAAAKEMGITGADLQVVLEKPPTKGAVEAWIADTGKDASDLLVEARKTKEWMVAASEEEKQ